MTQSKEEPHIAEQVQDLNYVMNMNSQQLDVADTGRSHKWIGQIRTKILLTTTPRILVLNQNIALTWQAQL